MLVEPAYEGYEFFGVAVVEINVGFCDVFADEGVVEDAYPIAVEVSEFEADDPVAGAYD